MKILPRIKTICSKLGIGERLLFARYPYMHNPIQVKCMLDLAVETSNVEGSYVEVGCAYGASTVLLMKTFDTLGIDRPGFALDTFEGFTQSHSDYDIDILGKDPSLRGYFQNNSDAWMRATLRVSNIRNVEVVKTDATIFDFDRCGAIAFALLDVDLYSPIIDIFPKLYERLSPGGVIVCDDCAEHNL